MRYVLTIISAFLFFASACFADEYTILSIRGSKNISIGGNLLSQEHSFLSSQKIDWGQTILIKVANKNQDVYTLRKKDFVDAKANSLDDFLVWLASNPQKNHDGYIYFSGRDIPDAIKSNIIINVSERTRANLQSIFKVGYYSYDNIPLSELSNNCFPKNNVVIYLCGYYFKEKEGKVMIMSDEGDSFDFGELVKACISKNNKSFIFLIEANSPQSYMPTFIKCGRYKNTSVLYYVPDDIKSSEKSAFYNAVKSSISAYDPFSKQFIPDIFKELENMKCNVKAIELR